MGFNSLILSTIIDNDCRGPPTLYSEQSTETAVQRRSQHGASNNESQSSQDILEASRLADSSVPDGGYGWVVVSACAVVTWWAVGMCYSWGVIQDALVLAGVSKASTLAYVGSLSVSLISGLAIINARIMSLVGAQRSALAGIFLLGVAEVLSSFAISSLPGLFFTSGVLLGLGISLCFMVTSAMPAQYFWRRRGLANGVVFAGAGVGGAVTSLALGGLIEHLGTAWAYRILGAVTLLTGLPAAWLVKERLPIRKSNLVDWKLFRDLSFVIVFAGGAIATFPLLVPPFFLPLYSRSVGLSASTGAALVAGFNLSSAVGRVLCGFLCDCIGPLNTLLLTLLVNGLSMLTIWPATRGLALLAVFVIISGAANGGFFATMPTVVGNVFGSQRVSVAMGMIVTGWGAGYLMGAPIAGYLLDAYGGESGGLGAYRPAMFYAGSMALGACGFVTLARFRTKSSIWSKV
ncbi:hypothetical protein CDD81_5353 [Ophiocordyceps australis]|uniref:Major facilitator superfamily (MFS) profile domain-containing protein n=1 Tax=Ophiocordyceps australis TaxID=1399860 RepID=A0A2C5Y352_9HYPO|nr:hypothetical protein CDD81_5353 [Ophiocordyceps australis]